MVSRAEPSTGPTEVGTGGKMRPLSEVLCQVELGPAAGKCGTNPEDNEERRRMDSRRQWPAGYRATERMAGLVGGDRSDAAGQGMDVRVKERSRGSSGRGPSQIPCRMAGTQSRCETTLHFRSNFVNSIRNKSW